MSSKLENTKEFAEDWSRYLVKAAGSRDLILWPHIRRIAGSIPTTVIADIGCGSGELTRRWLDLNASSVVGVDGNEHLLAKARTDTRGAIKYYQSDLELQAIPISDNTCDVVFSNCLAMHLTIGGVCNLGREAYRILKGNGVLVFSVTHYNWALRHYEVSNTADSETITRRMIGDVVLSEYFRPARWYTDMFLKSGFFDVADSDVLIPDNLPALEQRYQMESGCPLFTLITAKKHV